MFSWGFGVCFLTDRPGVSYNLKLIDCKSTSARIEWTPGPENNAEIEKFEVSYNTTFDKEGQHHVMVNVGKDMNEAQVSGQRHLTKPISENPGTVQATCMATYTTHTAPRPCRTTRVTPHLTWGGDEGLVSPSPANTKYLYNIYTMLDKRQRRWASVV